jgi:flavin reductase (DIM6/NTAB) family NADH-FMN oxidoreductase RutF
MILEPDKRNQVLPLPVVLISTISKDGTRNAAPWSCVMPILRPLDLVVIASWLKRDTLDNIRQTGEFVINVPPAEMADEVMICAKNFSPEVDEFEMAGLKARPSHKVKAPGIEGCMAWIECTLEEEIIRDKYSLIIGKVVHLEADDSIVNDNEEIDLERARQLSKIISKMSRNP